MNTHQVYPSQNVLWFWFSQQTRRILHGTLADSARKYDTLACREFPLDGLEIFLMPSKIMGPLTSEEVSFAKRYRNLGGRCVHIGETDVDFLLAPETPASLRSLAEVMDTLETSALVVHAHHFRADLARAAETLLEALPGVEVRVENNGFDAPWGADPTNVSSLLRGFPEFRFCLDIAHVADFPTPGLADFLSDSILSERLAEVHLSYSTHAHERDPYEERGYPGYGPFHALFSVLGLRPDSALAPLLAAVPVVLEGIVPREDDGLDFLREELRLAETAREE